MRKILLILSIFFIITPVYGFDLPVSQITDDSLLRLRLNNAWMIETPGRVLSQRARLESLETGERVRISTIEGREEFMVVIAREQMRGTSAANRRGTGEFPGWAQGSWMLTRRKDTGLGVQIRIFLRSDQNTHIQFRRFDDSKSLLDVILYGGFIARSIPVAVSFERLYTMRLTEILKLVENKFPLRYFEPDAAIYRDHRRFITQVRSHLGNLRFADDGAVDEDGSYVFINTLRSQSSPAGLNCSGFSKWLIDGMLRPVTGNRLTISQLKKPYADQNSSLRGSSFTEAWEESRDVFFGLDWIRNLAAEANGTLRSSAYRALNEFEVRVDNFSFILVNQNRTFVANSYPGFLHEAGYGVEGLHPLLYTLAIDEPFNFYLAAVNKEMSNPASRRGTPSLRQYFHIAAFIPYFDEYGNFKIVVFESAEETAFSGFLRRQTGNYVNLVRIPISSAFNP